MKTSLILLSLFTALCSFAEEKLPIAFPPELPKSELNREYVKDGRQVVSFKTRLTYPEACAALEAHLGDAWKMKIPTEEEAQKKAELLNDKSKPFVGLDVYLNAAHPDDYLTIAQIVSAAGGSEYPYLVTIAIGKKVDEN